jgi:hypothetical protein
MFARFDALAQSLAQSLAQRQGKLSTGAIWGAACTGTISTSISTQHQHHHQHRHLQPPRQSTRLFGHRCMHSDVLHRHIISHLRYVGTPYIWCAYHFETKYSHTLPIPMILI